MKFFPARTFVSCVLYPAPVRDLLLHLAAVELYKPTWTDTIQHEWIRNLLQNRPDITLGQLQKTADSMNKAFPDANVERYEALVSSFTLPDPNDRHILAAAIRCQAELIITRTRRTFQITIRGNLILRRNTPMSLSRM